MTEKREDVEMKDKTTVWAALLVMFAVTVQAQVIEFVPHYS